MHRVTENFKFQTGAAGDLVLDAQTLNNSNDATSYLDMRNHFSAVAVIIAGAIAGGGALACKLEQATDAAGTGVKDITGKTAAFTDAEGGLCKQIEVRAEELDAQGGFSFVRLKVTETGTQNAVVAGTIIKGPSRFAAATPIA